MLSWLIENIATIIICVILFAAVVLIIAGMVKNKKTGKSSCGCGCTNCSMSDSCHQKK